MFVVGRADMQAMDRYTAETIGLPGVVLMENAGARVVEEILAFGKKKVLVLAGSGQNGGDGFVIARRLIESGWEVKLCLLADPDKLRGDALVHYHVIINRNYPCTTVNQDNLVEIHEHIHRAEIIVDAMLGTGVRGDLRSPYDVIVKWVNEASHVSHASHTAKNLEISETPETPEKIVLSVDIPSGVCADTGHVQGEAIKATKTITFVCPKKGFFLPPGMTYVGDWQAVDISVPTSLVHTLGVDCPQLITEHHVQEWLPKRIKHGHKGSFGHVLVIGGSKHFVGAPLFSALASLNTGAGLVTLAIPEDIYPQVSAQCPSALFQSLPAEEGFFSLASIDLLKQTLSTYDTIVVGPGLGRWSAGEEWLHQLLSSTLNVPVLLDADALYHLAERKELILNQTCPVLLTPHPGEMARLLGMTVQEVEHDRIGIAQKCAADYQAYVILKGHRSVLATPTGEVWLNNTGHDALAKGGSGDVLAGMIAAFIGQGASPVQAMGTATYIQGLAAEQAAVKRSSYSTNATHILDEVGTILGQFVQ